MSEIENSAENSTEYKMISLHDYQTLRLLLSDLQQFRNADIGSIIIESYQKYSEKSNKKLFEFSDKMKKLERLNVELVTKLNLLKTEESIFNEKIEALQTRVLEGEQERIKYRNNSERDRAQLHQMENKIERLNFELNNALEEKRNLEKAMMEKAIDLKELQANLEAALNDARTARAFSVTVDNSESTTEAESEDLRMMYISTCETANERGRTISAIRAKFEKMKLELDSKNNDITKLYKRIEIMTEERKKLENECQVLKKELETSESNSQILKTEKDQLESEKITLEQEVEHLKQQLQNAQEALEKQEIQFQHVRQKSSEEIDVMHTESDATRSKLMYYKELWAQERDRVVSLQLRFNKQHSEFVKKLSDQEERYLEKIFNQQNQIDKLNFEKQNLIEEALKADRRALQLEQAKESKSNLNLFTRVLGKQ